jgi:hypothetical protein
MNGSNTLGKKGLPGTNTIAYWDGIRNTLIKS